MPLVKLPEKHYTHINMILIDGSQGEGGGQIVRTALSLSAVTGKPFTISNIRAKRKKPGLLAQHLTAVKALTTICNARVEGDKLGSGELIFYPGEIQPGTYFFNVGTAGSCTLILQTLLPVLLKATAPSAITLEGGTHNPLAPPYDFLAKSFLPHLVNMGAWINTKIDIYGFYPAGGGRIFMEMAPAMKLEPLELITAPVDYEIKATALSANIPPHIIKEEIEILKNSFQLKPENCLAQEVNSPGPGNAVMVQVTSTAGTELFTAFGARGLPLQRVCEKVIKEVKTYLDAKVPIGSHLADQLLIPMALAGGKGFRTLKPSLHTLTNLDIIPHFLDIKSVVRKISGKIWEISIQ